MTIKLKSGMRGVNNPLLKLIDDLPDNIIMAEVGCYAGESTLMFLQSGKIRKLYAIDPWKSKLEGVIEGSKEEIERYNYVYSKMEWAEASFDMRIYSFMNIVIKLKMTLLEAINILPELDFIYIDADHRYKSVLNDIQLAKKIVKKGGIIAGHDYIETYNGVIKAVNESFEVIDKIYDDSSWLKQIV